jgi:uncharacterized protein (DUF1778 family)
VPDTPKRPRGRPRGWSPVETPRTEHLPAVRVTPAERETIEAAADALEIPVSEFVRRAALKAATP